MKRQRRHRDPARERGSALLMAMLIVALVATLAASGYWRQWQAWAAERAERQRDEASWVLVGALDWARLILREDARASQIDHLGEPWSVPLQEARLSDFLSTDRRSGANPGGKAADQTQDVDLSSLAFLSGTVTDLQGRINLRNLLTSGTDGDGAAGAAQQATISPADVAATQRLFQLLGLPETELALLVNRLPLAWAAAQASTSRTASGSGGDARGGAANAAAGGAVDPTAPLLPQRFEQLGVLGLSSATLQALELHATWLPERTALNVNTASLIALQASIPRLESAQAQRIAALRQQRPYASLAELRAALQAAGAPDNLVTTQSHAVSSRYFSVVGHLRLDEQVFEERALVVRNGITVSTVWRASGRGHARVLTMK
jgi:general secretion pathway protein K